MSLGIRYMLISTLFFTGMQSFAKSLSHLPVLEVLFFRSLVTAIFCIFYLKRHNISLIGNNQKLLFLRTIFGILSLFLFFFTLQRMPLGASVSLKYLSPIFTAVFAILFLKEKVKPIQWLFFVGALLGAFLLKGFDTRIDMLNFILGIGGAAAGGLVYVIIRKIGNSEHPIVIIHYFMTSATVIAGGSMLLNWVNPTLNEYFFLIGMGVLGYYAQVFMTKAFQIEMASKIVQLKYLEVVYSLIIGLIWFRESYAWGSLLGIILILVCMVLNITVKQKVDTYQH